jgi:hypothetical protein
VIGILAILGIFKVEGMTRQMYETLRKDVNWEHNPPKGLIFHSAAFGDSGNTLHVADVWESEEDLNDFFSGRLMQSMRDNKIPEPKAEIFQINDVSAFPGIDKFRVG